MSIVILQRTRQVSHEIRHPSAPRVWLYAQGGGRKTAGQVDGDDGEGGGDDEEEGGGGMLDIKQLNQVEIPVRTIRALLPPRHPIT